MVLHLWSRFSVFFFCPIHSKGSYTHDPATFRSHCMYGTIPLKVAGWLEPSHLERSTVCVSTSHTVKFDRYLLHLRAPVQIVHLATSHLGRAPIFRWILLMANSPRSFRDRFIQFREEEQLHRSKWLTPLSTSSGAPHLLLQTHDVFC